ncbi:hypothetical protein GCM10023257_61130 [Streptomyces hyderabadensis]|uniref:Uncharacterized protein n=1 Tax=Streptomyces hyderabadensis TaxID=598549 RepID=A0ABP9IRY7_9ACTN
MRPLYPVPALALLLTPVGFASGKGKVKEPDEPGPRPSTAPQAWEVRAHIRLGDHFVADGERLRGGAR